MEDIKKDLEINQGLETEKILAVLKGLTIKEANSILFRVGQMITQISTVGKIPESGLPIVTYLG